MLQGLAFALFYTLLGLPIARAADSRNRRNIIVSLPGIVAIIAMLFVKEPKRRIETNREKEHFTFGEVLAFISEKKRFILTHFVGFSLLCTASYGVLAWGPTYFIRTFQWSAGDAGIYIGIVVLLVGTTAIMTGGIIVDKLLTTHSWHKKNGRFCRPFFLKNKSCNNYCIWFCSRY